MTFLPFPEKKPKTTARKKKSTKSLQDLKIKMPKLIWACTEKKELLLSGAQCLRCCELHRPLFTSLPAQ